MSFSLRLRDLPVRFIDILFGYDFFICYAWQDGRKYAEVLAQRLREEDLVCFLDSTDFGMGQLWRMAGERALRKTSNLILIGTDGALQSEPVRRELEVFYASGRKIIPITIGDVLRSKERKELLFNYLPEDLLYIHEELGNLQFGPSENTLEELKRSFKLTRQEQKRLHWVGSAGAIFLGLIGFAMWLNWQKTQREILAAANRLAFQAEALRSSDIILSSRDARQSVKMVPNDTTWSSFLRAYYNMQNGWLLSRHNLGNSNIQTLSFSDSGRELLVASYTTLRINSLDGSSRELTLPGVTDIRSAFYRPGNSDQILVSHGDTASIWSLSDRRRLWTASTYKEDVITATWSGNGTRILVMSNHSRVSVFGGANMQIIRTWDARPAAALSFDGRWVALTSMDYRLAIESVDQQGSTPSVEHKVHSGAIRCLTFSPDGNFLAVAFGSNGLRLWKLDQQKLEGSQALDGHLQGIYSLHFSPDSSLLVSASDDGGALVWSTEVPDPAGEQANWLLADDRIPRRPLLKNLRHATDLTTVTGPFGGRTNLVSFAAFSPQGNTVATGVADGSVAFWFLGGDIEGSQQFHNVDHTADYASKKNWLASAAGQQLLLLDTTGPGRVVLESDTLVACTALSPTSTSLVVGSENGELSYWKLNQKKEWTRIWKMHGHQDKISSCSFSPDGELILSTGLDGKILLWETKDVPHRLRSLSYDGEPRKVWTGAFSYNGKYIAAAGDLGKLYVFSIAGSRELTIEVPGRIDDTAFDQSGRILTANGSGSEVRLWSRNGKCLAQLKHPTDDEVLRAVFSKDGSWIISATMSGVVHIWDVSEPNITGRELVKWQAHDSWIEQLALSPSGDHLLTLCSRGRVRLWPISVSEIERQFRRLTSSR